MIFNSSCSGKRRRIVTFVALQVLISSFYSITVHSLTTTSSSKQSSSLTKQAISQNALQQQQQQQQQSSSSWRPFEKLSGDWSYAKSSLSNPNCCVVSIHGIDSHLNILQKYLADNGPNDIDLRAKIRINPLSSSSSIVTSEDCRKVIYSILPSLSEDNNKDNENVVVVAALEELARGMSSFANEPLSASLMSNDRSNMDVFVRIVCASNYRAREPPFHTDKAPLRGYTTLRGVGTEYMTTTSSPLEYMKLRTFGWSKQSGTINSSSSSSSSNRLQQAKELQFIVMKGDYYYDKLPHNNNDNINKADSPSIYNSQKSSFVDKIWSRARACVHRSPPGNDRRRVIVSFDLADGDDDREWLQIGTKREWRNGLTQRKSHLVA